jgi:hypothetical protein
MPLASNTTLTHARLLAGFLGFLQSNFIRCRKMACQCLGMGAFGAIHHTDQLLKNGWRV